MLIAALAAVSLCSAPLPFSPRSAGDGIEDLSAALAGYLDACESGGNSEAARAVFEIALGQFAQETGRTPLSDPSGLGRAWRLAQRGKERIQRGNVEDAVLEQARFEDGLRIAYRVPKDVDPSGSGLPLVLTIPDAGEEPAHHLRARWTERSLLDQAILVAPEMPADKSEWDRVTVGGRPGGLCHVLTALREARRLFDVDPDRVYVVGHGKGVPAAVAAGHHAPERLAGVVGLGGDLGELSGLNVSNFMSLPVLLVGGGTQATNWLEAAEREGVASCERKDKATTTEVWQWMLAHPRKAAPESVRLAVGQPFPTRAHWLRIAPTTPDANATAHVDRAQNTIEIEAHGASLVTLYLNDELVDLDRPLKIVCNGETQERSVKRDVETTLRSMHDETSDPGCVYVAQVVLDLTDAALVSDVPLDESVSQRIDDAGQDSAALWSLYETLAASDHARGAERVLRRILRAAPDHAGARGALGHGGEPGSWFRTAGAYERHLRRQDPESAQAAGLVEHRGSWVHPEHRKLASKNWTWQPATGEWLSRSDTRRLEDGWQRQDFTWVAPEEADPFEGGLWKVGDGWMTLADANRRHARVDDPWRVPGAEVVVRSTADRAIALRASEEMGRAIEDLQRVFGALPPLPLEVAVLRDEEQYDRFAFGDPDGRRAPTNSGGLHVVHSAFFADRWYEPAGGKLEFRGMGVCYWDPLIPGGDAYGVHSARLAVGLSYVEALDPSPKTVRKAISRGIESSYRDSYEAEKRLPAWLRYGGAVYAERYFHDDSVPSDGDPWWARNWSLTSLNQRGGLREPSDVFRLRLDASDRDDAFKYLLEAGLLVAFVVDGKCAPVAEAHAELRRKLAFGALPSGQRGRLRSTEALEQAILENASALRAFAAAE